MMNGYELIPLEDKKRLMKIVQKSGSSTCEGKFIMNYVSQSISTNIMQQEKQQKQNAFRYQNARMSIQSILFKQSTLNVHSFTNISTRFHYQQIRLEHQVRWHDRWHVRNAQKKHSFSSYCVECKSSWNQFAHTLGTSHNINKDTAVRLLEAVSNYRAFEKKC